MAQPWVGVDCRLDNRTRGAAERCDLGKETSNRMIGGLLNEDERSRADRASRSL
jgi:hypothetical protein